MFKNLSLAFLASASCLACSVHAASAYDSRALFVVPSVNYAGQQMQQPMPQQPMPQRVAYAERGNMGGGFIEFLFSDGAPPSPRYQPSYENRRPLMQQMEQQQGETLEPARPDFDPKFEPQMVDYPGKESPGTIVIDTPNKFLFLVQSGGKAMRYGVGVGKPGFTWSGVKHISAKKEWPDWTPPPEMLVRRPDLPRHMEGGPANPLGARAMYLGTTLYRIHGSNEPWTIGTNVSSGCIRMRNQDVIDLYGRVNVGTKVIII
jgi:lipoprotein-anchoring transpeptidase ErfK/SrfK